MCKKVGENVLICTFNHKDKDILQSKKIITIFECITSLSTITMVRQKSLQSILRKKVRCK